MSEPTDPTPTEVALREAAGFRLLRIDGRPNWVKDSTITIGGVTIPIECARITGTDGADAMPRESRKGREHE